MPSSTSSTPAAGGHQHTNWSVFVLQGRALHCGDGGTRAGNALFRVSRLMVLYSVVPNQWNGYVYPQHTTSHASGALRHALTTRFAAKAIIEIDDVWRRKWSPGWVMC